VGSSPPDLVPLTAPEGVFLLLSNTEVLCRRADSVISKRRDPESSCLRRAELRADNLLAWGVSDPPLGVGGPLVRIHSMNSACKCSGTLAPDGVVRGILGVEAREAWYPSCVTIRI
jgi:hypothetical protein